MAKIALIVGRKAKSPRYQSCAMDGEKLLGRNHTVFFIDPLELNLPLLDRIVLKR